MLARSSGNNPAVARLEQGFSRMRELEELVSELSRRYGSVFKEALASLDSKLISLRGMSAGLPEVGPLRAQILWRQIVPHLEALEEGQQDLRRLLQAVRELKPPPPEHSELVYEELLRRERWFLRRLRYTSGESVAEGAYRCCACGAFVWPGPSQILGRCSRCGGDCHHHVAV